MKQVEVKSLVDPTKIAQLELEKERLRVELEKRDVMIQKLQMLVKQLQEENEALKKTIEELSERHSMPREPAKSHIRRASEAVIQLAKFKYLTP